MGVVSIASVRKKVIEKLHASPDTARYTDSITGGANSDYSVLAEFTDAILDVDAEICLDICSTPGHPYASLFMALSAAMSSGAEIDEHIGAYGDVQVAISGIYLPSVPAKSREDILAFNANPTLYGMPARRHYIEGGHIYHSGDQGSASVKIFYPVFAKTSVCQAHEAYESLEVYGTIGAMEKEGADSQFFRKYQDLYLLGRSLIRDKELLIPGQQKLERMLSKAA